MNYKSFYNIPENGWCTVIAASIGWDPWVRAGFVFKYVSTDFKYMSPNGMTAFFTPLKIYFNYLDLEFNSSEIENKKLKEIIKEL